VPPEPVTGVKDVEGWFIVSIVVAMAVVATTAGFTVRVKDACPVAWLLSVTVTV
jgi:hypothetical protein